MTWIARLLTAVLLALVAAGSAVAEGRRLALVVGNGAYDHFPTLDNAVTDANSIARALRAQDFDVTLLTDVGTEVFEAVLDTFARQADGADTVLFYYAGHAFQMNGVNHLVPASARISSAEDVQSATWKLDDIAARLKGGTAQLLIFLDACRTTPLPQGVAGGADGLAQFDGGAGTFVAFATRPGAVAYDGGPGGSPFTQAVVQRLATLGQSVSDLMIAVRNDVQQATGGAQVPWEQSSLRAQFYFVPAVVPVAADALPQFDVVQSASTVGGPAAPAQTTAATPLAETPAADPEPAVIQMAALEPRPAMTGETRGVEVLAPRAPAVESMPQVTGVQPALPTTAPLPELAPIAEPAPAPLAVAPPDVAPAAVPPATDTAPPPPRFATIADLARATQTELKRIGCYGSTIDGDWGNGSRRALGRYYDAKNLEPKTLEPDEALYDDLAAAPEATCEPIAVAAPAPNKPAGTKAKAGQTTRKSAAKTPTTKKAAAPAPAAKKKVECKWVVVAIVCK